MNKEEVLKELFQLPKDDILDILEIINGYKERVNKSKKDSLLTIDYLLLSFVPVIRLFGLIAKYYFIANTDEFIKRIKEKGDSNAKD